MNTTGTFIHPSAHCETSRIGPGCKVGAYSLIAASASIGANTSIGRHVTVDDGVVIGEGVVVGDGARICTVAKVENGVDIGPNAVLLGPAGRDGTPPTILHAACRIGANATILPGMSIGQGARVEAGSMVSTNIQPYAVVSGNPAVVTGFSGMTSPDGSGDRATVPGVVIRDSLVRGVKTYRIPFILDIRGNLAVGEFERTLPFQPKRFFMTFDVPNAHLRGEHAHRECQQLLFCVRGSCAVVVDDGRNRQEYLLCEPTLGVYVPPMVWATEYKHSADSVLVVFASHYYDPDDYIRDYPEFLRCLESASR